MKKKNDIRNLKTFQPEVVTHHFFAVKNSNKLVFN